MSRGWVLQVWLAVAAAWSSTVSAAPGCTAAPTAAASYPAPPGSAADGHCAAANAPAQGLQFSGPWSTARAAAVQADIDQLQPLLEPIRIVSRNSFIPSHGPFTLLVYKPFADKEVPASPGSGGVGHLTYRAFITESDTQDPALPGSAKSARVSQAIGPSQIWAEQASRGTTAAPGTDFKPDEPPEGKTLLHLDANVDGSSSLWRHARVYVIGGTGAEGSTPTVIGSFETVVASKRWAIGLSLVACATAYLAAALATFYVHQGQRAYRPANEATSWTQRLAASFTNRQAKVDHGHGPLTGTNYATFWAHLNPVVLCAGNNGLGSAGNLQVLFFSIVVFGVVLYIWLLTGHLTGMSDTVLLLMGISGIGATASAGAEISKNRLSFTSWAWLIDRNWLPQGGIAEVTIAKWKDIFTTGGTFDVYHFQMICFSVVVGLALIGAGVQLDDLSGFDVPQAVLGILGLSQVVYVSGKLVAPPAISDLDKQIGELQTTEKKLRDLIDASSITLPAAHVVSWNLNDDLSALRSADDDYLEMWDQTKTMFEATYGRVIPPMALEKRPPFVMPGAVLNQLKDARAGAEYLVPLQLVGAPADAYVWEFDGGRHPEGMEFVATGHPDAIGLHIPAQAPARAGEYRFTVRVTGASPDRTRTKDFTLRVIR